jgi:hypothetical protein
MITATELLTPAQVLDWAKQRAAAAGYVAPQPPADRVHARPVPRGKGRDPFGPTARLLKFAQRHAQFTREQFIASCPDLDRGTLGGLLCNLEAAGKLRVQRRYRADGGNLYSLAPSYRRNGETAKRRAGDSALRTPQSALA